MHEDPATYFDGTTEVHAAAPGAAVSSSGPTAGGASPTATAPVRDPGRVERWAHLLDGDAEARAYMQRHLGGAALAEAHQRIAALSAERERLVLMQRYGIDAELGELHLTAADPQVLEQQAHSLATLLYGSVGTGPALSAVGPELATSDAPTEGSGGVPPPDTADGQPALPDARAGGMTGTEIGPTEGVRPTESEPLPTYGVPASREELLEEQFRRLYRA